MWVRTRSLNAHGSCSLVKHLCNVFFLNKALYVQRRGEGIRNNNNKKEEEKKEEGRSRKMGRREERGKKETKKIRKRTYWFGYVDLFE